MIDIIISGISGISIGIYAGLKYSNHVINKELNNKNRKVKNAFDRVFHNMEEVSFTKRVNNYVYLVNGEIDILIDLKKNMIYLSSGDEFLTDSRYLDENHSNKLFNDINTRFYNEINNVVVFGDYIISKNLGSIAFEPINPMEEFQDDEEFELDFDDVKFNVDMLLDKIGAFGISSLTEEEMEFLKNQGE
jgi:hypothetical protein